MKEDAQQPRPKPVSGIGDSKLNITGVKKKTVRINLPPAPPAAQPIELSAGADQPARPWWKFWQR